MVEKRHENRQDTWTARHSRTVSSTMCTNGKQTWVASEHEPLWNPTGVASIETYLFGLCSGDMKGNEESDGDQRRQS